MTSGERKAEASAPSALLAEWFRTWETPALIVRRDLSVISANLAARGLAELNDDLDLSDGRLALGDAGQTQALARFLVGVRGEPRMWSSARSGQGGFWVVRAQRMEVDGLEPAFGVSVIASASPPVRVWADLSAPFMLTPSEEKVARHLFEGRTATELAALMGITVETARTYIRRIYLKTGASSREKLYSALEPFQAS